MSVVRFQIVLFSQGQCISIAHLKSASVYQSAVHYQQSLTPPLTFETNMPVVAITVTLRKSKCISLMGHTRWLADGAGGPVRSEGVAALHCSSPAAAANGPRVGYIPSCLHSVSRRPDTSAGLDGANTSHQTQSYCRPAVTEQTDTTGTTAGKESHSFSDLNYILQQKKYPAGLLPRGVSQCAAIIYFKIKYI